MKNIGPLIQPLINSFIECKRSELGKKESGRKHSRCRELRKRERTQTQQVLRAREERARTQTQQVPRATVNTQRLLSMWWLLAWRGNLGGFVLGAIAGFVSQILFGTGAIGGAVAGLLAGLAWNLVVIQML